MARFSLALLAVLCAALLSATAAPAAVTTHTFDAANEMHGWGAVPGTAAWDAAGGNPSGGGLSVTAGSGVGYFAHTSLLSGDVRSAIGGSMSFDLKTPLYGADDVILQTASGYIYYQLVYTPELDWEHFDVPLSVSGDNACGPPAPMFCWKNPTGQPLTEQQFSDALAFIQAIKIRATASGTGTGYMDNFVLDVPDAPPGADLSITVAATPTTATLGDSISYTVDVTNHGPASSPGTYVYIDALPSATSVVTPNDAGCDGTSSVTCPLGDLASGATRRLVIPLRTSPFTGSPMTVTVRADGALDDANAANDTASATVTLNEPTHTGSTVGNSTTNSGGTTTTTTPDPKAVAQPIVDAAAAEALADLIAQLKKSQSQLTTDQIITLMGPFPTDVVIAAKLIYGASGNSASAAKARQIGGGSLSLAKGATGKLKIKLSKKGKALLKKKGKLKISVNVTVTNPATGAAKTVTKVMTVKAKKRKRR